MSNYDLYIKQLKNKYNKTNQEKNLGLSDVDIDRQASMQASELQRQQMMKANQPVITAPKINTTQPLSYSEQAEQNKIDWADNYEEESLNWWERTGAYIMQTFDTLQKGVYKGVVEGLVDLGASAVGNIAGWFGNEELKNNISDFVKRDLTEETFNQEWMKQGKKIFGGGWMFGDRALDYSYNDKATDDFTKNIAQGISSSLTFAAYTPMGPVGWGLALGSVAGSSTEEAIKDGATLEKASLYGLGNAAIEGASEVLVGKFLNFLGKGTSSAANRLFGTNISGRLANQTFGGIGKQYGKSIALNMLKEFNEEGLEEVFSDVLNPIVKMIYKECDSDNFFDNYKQLFNENGGWQGLLESYFYGGMSAVVIGGANTTARIAHYGSLKAVQFENSLANVTELNAEIQEELNKNDFNKYPDASKNPKIEKLLRQKEYLREKIGEDFKDWLDTVKEVYDDVVKKDVQSLAEGKQLTNKETRNVKKVSAKEGLRQAGEYTLNSTVEDLQSELGEKATNKINYDYIGTDNVNKTNLSKKIVYVGGKQTFREYVKSVIHEIKHIGDEGLNKSTLTDEIIKGMSKEAYDEEFEKQSILEGDVYLKTDEGKDFLKSKNLTLDRYNELSDEKKIELKKEAAIANPAWFNEEVAAEHLIDYFANFKEFNRVIDGVSQKGIRKLLNTFRKAFQNTSNKPANYNEVIKALQDGLKAERKNAEKITSTNVKNTDKSEKKFGKNENTLPNNEDDDIIRSREVEEDDFRRLQETSRNLLKRFKNTTKTYRELDERVRERYTRGIRAKLAANRNSDANVNEFTLKSASKGTTFKIYSNVDTNLFHDAFETIKPYLAQNELVDLHKKKEYKKCKCYLSEDGLQGFAIEPDGNLISAFNADTNKRGYIEAIKDFVIEQGGTHLDCYGYLAKYYEKALGFHIAATMDYNMEYDHHNIAERHNMPEISFLVKNEVSEVKHFDKDSYDDAKAYQMKNIAENTNEDKVKYRITEDSNGNELTEQQQEYFKNSKVVDSKGRLLVVYHGTNEDFTVFNGLQGFNWFSDSKSYAEQYGDITMPVYLNIEKMFDLGEINNQLDEFDDYDNVKTINIKYNNENLKVAIPADVENLAKKVGCTTKELLEIALDSYDMRHYEEKGITYFDGGLFNITRTDDFMNILKLKGYDGVMASEGGYITYGVINPNQAKNIDTTKPTDNDDIRYRITGNKDFDEVVNADNYTKNENLAYDRYLRNTAELVKIANTDDEKIIELVNKYVDKIYKEYYIPFTKEIKSEKVDAQKAVNLYYNYLNSVRAIIDYREDILEFATQKWQEKFDDYLARLVKNLPKAKQLISKFDNVKAQEVLNTVKAVDTRTTDEIEEIERERNSYTSKREAFEAKLSKKKVDVKKFKNTAIQLEKPIKEVLDNVKLDKPFARENTKTRYYNEVVAPFDTLIEQYKITLRDVKISEEDIDTAINYLINDMLGGRHYRNARLKKIDFIREQYDNLSLPPQEIVNTIVENQPVESTPVIRTRFINNSRKVATPDMAGIKAQADLRKDGKVYTLNSVMNLTKAIESSLRNEPALSGNNATIDYEGSTRELKSLEIAMILNEYNNSQYVKEESKQINYSNLTNEQKIDKITSIIVGGITLDYNGTTTRLNTLIDANDTMAVIVEEYIRGQVENLVNNEGKISKITKVLERQEKAFKERLNALKQKNSDLTRKIIELNDKVEQEKRKGKEKNKELIKKYNDKIKELKKQSNKEIRELRYELRRANRKIDTLIEKNIRKEELIRKYQRRNMELYTDNKGIKKIKYDDILMLNDLGKQINPDFKMSAYVENQIVNYLSKAQFDKAVDLYMNAILNSDYVDGDEVKPFSYFVGDYAYGDDLLLEDSATFENDIMELRDEMIEIFKGSEISTRQKFIDKIANMATYNYNLKMRLRETRTSLVVYRHAFRAFNTARRVHKKIIEIDKNGGSKSGNRLAGTSPEWVNAVLDFAQGTDDTRALNKMTPDAIINGEHKVPLKNLLDAYERLEKDGKVEFPMPIELKEYIRYLLNDDVQLNGKYVDIYKRVLNGINRLIESEIGERKIKFGNVEGAIKDVSRRMQAENTLKEGEKEETFRFTQGFLTPYAVVDKLAKYQEQAVIRQIYEELFNAEMKKEEADIKLREPFIEFREKNKKVAKSFFKSLRKEVTITYGDKTITANKSKFFSFYEAFKREQAKGHIENKFGGIEIGNKIYQFETYDELQALVNAIEKEFNLDNSKSVNAQYLKSCEKFFEIAREYKREVDIERLGFSNVEDGFYFPIAIANGDAQAAISSEDFFKTNMPGTYNYSFNRNTTGKMGAIKLLDIEDIIERHSRQMATYTGYGAVVDNIRKVWNYKLEGGKNVRKTILSRFVNGDGLKVERYIATLINDVQGIGQGTNSNVDTLFKKVVNKLRGNVAKVALGANPKVMLSQTASIPAAMRYIKGRYLLKAMTMRVKNLPEKPAMLLYRENHELVGQAETQGAIDKLGSVFTRGINFFDKVAIDNIWKASLLQTRNADGSWNIEEATKLAQKTVFDTQPNYLALGRSEFLRSKNDFVKLFTMFQSQAQQNLSMAYDSINKILYKKRHKLPITKDDWSDLGHALAALFIQALVYTGMGELFSHIVKNDWKDIDFSKSAGDFGIAMINDNLIGMIPIINNVEIDLEKQWKFNIERLGSGFIDNYVDIIQNFEGFDKMSIQDWNTALSYTFGLPGTNIYKWTKAFGQYLPNAEDYLDDFDTFYRGKKITKATVTNSSTKTLERKNYRQYSKNNGLDAGTITKLYNLYSKGYNDVIIKAISEEFTKNDVKIPVNREDFLKVYGKLSSGLNSVMNSKSYAKYTEEQQAKIISKVIDIYYNTSKKSITGDNMNLLENIVYSGKNIDVDTLYAILKASEIEADEKSTRKDKITKYINKLRLSRANKYFIYAALGYSVDSNLYKTYLIKNLRLTNSQIKKMFSK